MTDVLDVARSPDELRRAITRDAGPSGPEVQARRLALAEPYLGVLDGRASERVWQVCEEVAARNGPPDAGVLARRAALEGDAAEYCGREAARAGRRLAVRSAVATIAGVVPGAAGRAALRRLRERVRSEQDRRLECEEGARRQFRPLGRLVGHTDEDLVSAGVRLAAKLLSRGAARG
jgi:hypothetical protein